MKKECCEDMINSICNILSFLKAVKNRKLNNHDMTEWAKIEIYQAIRIKNALEKIQMEKCNE